MDYIPLHKESSLPSFRETGEKLPVYRQLKFSQQAEESIGSPKKANNPTHRAQKDIWCPKEGRECYRMARERVLLCQEKQT